MQTGRRAVIGQTVGHYRIVEKLGSGGMGIVYKAEDTRLRRTVALKFLPPELTRDSEARARFLQEARAASLLDHPNICTIHDIEETPEGASFICMAYCEGETLRRKIARGRLPEDEATGYAIQLAEGLAKAHAQGIIHRDIKPANLIVSGDGVLKIVDFGLAKLAGQASLTRTGSLMGTAAYLSPEQARGDPVDHRTDLWSAGVVLFEMVTGGLPFKAEHEQALVHAILNASVPTVASRLPEADPEVARITEKAMRREPEERYQTALELRDDLRRLAQRRGQGSEPALIESAPTLVIKRSRTRRLAVVAAAALLAAASVLLVPKVRHATRAWLTRGVLAGETRMLVLPFANVGGEPGNRALCDGLVETITSKLTQLSQLSGTLWVVPASEVRAAELASAAAARAKLGAELAVTGSVQRDGDRLRVTLNLVDTSSLRQLSSVVIDEAAGQPSALQDGAVLELARMLGVEVPAPSRATLTAGGTAVPGAYELYLEGRGHLQHYDRIESIAAATAALQRAIGKDPRFALAWAGLGEAFWRTWGARKDPDSVRQAIAACRHALELDARVAAAHLTLGMIQAGTGKHEEAVAELSRARELDPRNGDVYRELAELYRVMGKSAEAEATYRQAIALDPRSWSAHNLLGAFYLEQGRLEDAIVEFRKVIALAPDSPWGYNNLGGIYLYLGRTEEARRAFESSIAIQPNYGACSNLGTLYFHAGRMADAAGMYEKALALNDADYTVWGNLAASYYWNPPKRGEAPPLYRRAVAMAERQLEVNPKSPEVLADLAEYHATLGEAAKAMSYLKRALELAPADNAIAFRAGLTYERLGRRAEALVWVGKALQAGYPPAEVEQAIPLTELRADPRYGKLAAPASASPRK